jgi:hypothetical protein
MKFKFFILQFLKILKILKKKITLLLNFLNSFEIFQKSLNFERLLILHFLNFPKTFENVSRK